MRGRQQDETRARRNHPLLISLQTRSTPSHTQQQQLTTRSVVSAALAGSTSNNARSRFALCCYTQGSSSHLEPVDTPCTGSRVYSANNLSCAATNACLCCSAPLCSSLTRKHTQIMAVAAWQECVKDVQRLSTYPSAGDPRFEPAKNSILSFTLKEASTLSHATVGKLVDLQVCADVVTVNSTYALDQTSTAA